MKIAVLVVVAALANVPASALAQTPATSQTIAGHAGQTTITVVGTGTESRPPDTAAVSAQVIASDPNASASLSHNNDLYNTVRAKLVAAGVPESAIHTQFFTMNYIAPQTAPNAYHPAHTGFVTTRTLTIEVNPIDRVGAIIDAATAAGATELGGVQFGLKDRKNATNAALASAVRDARAQADVVAAAAGLHVERIAAITTASTAVPYPQPRMMMAAAPATPTEIEPGGPVNVTASVTITFDVR